jgi:hypothetical protein
MGIWVDLAERIVSANAHRTRDEEPLRRLQLQLEDAISERHPECDELMIELVAWELTLTHDPAPQTPPETCLTCRKLRAQIPLQLPLPAGGTR